MNARDLLISSLRFCLAGSICFYLRLNQGAEELQEDRLIFVKTV